MSKTLLRAARAKDPDALQRFQIVPTLAPGEIPALHDAQFVLAREYGFKSWNEMRGVLKSFMWIGLLHDKPGKDVFDSIFP